MHKMENITDNSRNTNDNDHVSNDIIAGGKPIMLVVAIVYVFAFIFHTPAISPSEWDLLLEKLLHPIIVTPLVTASFLFVLVGPMPNRFQVIRSLIAMPLGVGILFLTIHLFDGIGLLVWFFIGIPMSIAVSSILIRNPIDN